MNSRNLKLCLEMNSGITPNLASKTAFISELIKEGNKAVKSRIVALAGEGVQLTDSRDEQVNTNASLQQFFLHIYKP